MIWGVAILTMLVGSVLALTQTDVKRMLAYSSIAHAGFILVGMAATDAVMPRASCRVSRALLPAGLRLHHARRLRDRHAGPRRRQGEATHLSQWAGLAKRSPVVAAVFAFFLLAFAGIPLTSGFIAKFAVFKAAIGGRRRRRWSSSASSSSAIAAFFYVRVIVLMFFSDAGAGRPDRGRPEPADHVDASRSASRSPCSWASVPPQVLDLADQAAQFVRWTSAAVTAQHRLTAAATDPALAAVAAARAGRRSRRRCATPSSSEYPFVTEASRHLVEAGGKRFRPLLVLLAAQFGDAEPRRGRAVGGRRRAHPPRHAVPRRRDGRGGRAPRGARARTRAGATPSRSSPATSCSPARPTSSPTSARRPCACRPAPSRGWSTGPDPRDRRPGRGRRPLEHYLSVLADKTGSLIATSARFGAMLAGARRGVGRHARPSSAS